MRRQAAKIKVCVVNAAFLISSFLINEKADSNAAVTVSVSESVINSLDNVWFNYEEDDDTEALNKINENIVYIDEALDILREAYNKSSKHADMLSLVYIEKAMSELEDARIECCKEKIHYMYCSGIH